MPQTLSWDLYGNDRLSGLLEKLDRTLASTAAKLDRTGEQAVRMGADMSRAEQSTQNLASRMERMSSTASSVGSHVSGAFSTMGSVIGAIGITSLVSDIGRGLESLATFAVSSAAQMQSSRVSFELMLGSAQKATDFLAKLQDFAVVTPFQLSDLQTYASRLLAVGVQAGDIIPILRRIGDATAAVGSGTFGIERAVNALNEMRLSGDVSLIHLRELAFAGIPIFDALAAKLHTTTAKVIEMNKANEISVQDVFDAVEQGTGKQFAKINGMMDKQSATLLGKWSNLKDSAQQTFGKALTPMIPFLSGIVDFAGKSIPRVIDGLKRMAGQISGVFKGSDVPQKLIDGLRQMGEQILPHLRSGWEHIVKAVADNKDGLEKFGRFIAKMLPLVGASIGAVIDGLSAMIGWTISAIAHFESFFSWVMRHFLDFVSFTLHAAAAAFGWVPGLGPKLRAAESDFETFRKGVLRQLDLIDGKTVRVKIEVDNRLSQGVQVKTALSAGGAVRKRATGGYNQAGDLLQLGDMGDQPEVWYATSPGRTLTASQAGAAGGSDGVVGTLVVRHEYPDASRNHEELLKLKRGRGPGFRLGLT